MQSNEIPKMNMDKSETGCCPKFDPIPWNQQEFIFDNKLFAKAKTVNILHFPINIKSMYKRVWGKIEEVGAASEDNYLVLSYDPSLWRGEHYFAVKKDLPGEEMVILSGTYLSKVYKGPYKDVGKWVGEMEEYVKSKGKEMKKLYFFYTTCPMCAEHYGENYVVAFAEV